MPQLSSDDQSYDGAMMRATGASEYDAFAFIVQQLLGRSATAMLVQVKAVHGGGTAEIGTVDVQPMVHQIDGAGNAVPHGTINNLPYLRIQGGSNALIIDPKAGDIGIAWFASHDLSTVKQTKAPALPGSRRRFDWADGLYGGGFLNGVPTNFIQVSDDGIQITSAAGKPVNITAPGGVTITSPMVHFTGDISTGPGSTFNGKSFDSHTHGGVQTGGGTSGPPS